MYPTREQALALLAEAEPRNPGPWGDHSRTAAHCGEKIAAAVGLDPDKAFVLGLLHDIGRRYGKRHLGHVSDGYTYMIELGYDEVARVCMSHSFNDQSLASYVGHRDTTPEETALIERELATMVYDDYDRLIQLCDSLAEASGVVDIEERMADVKRRYGDYPQNKWDINLALKAHFEHLAGRSIYDVVERDSYRPST